MQDMRCSCAMLEKRAFEGCHARYEINVSPTSQMNRVLGFPGPRVHHML